MKIKMHPDVWGEPKPCLKLLAVNSYTEKGGRAKVRTLRPHLDSGVRGLSPQHEGGRKQEIRVRNW